MSEDKTKDLNENRSFEERVFARFDSIGRRFDKVDERFERVEGRLSAVEDRLIKLCQQQDQERQVWENLHSAIAENRRVFKQKNGD